MFWMLVGFVIVAAVIGFLLLFIRIAASQGNATGCCAWTILFFCLMAGALLLAIIMYGLAEVF